MLLEANNLNFSVKDRVLINIEHLQIHEHDRIGLVGKNGTGKTTLLNVLANKFEQNNGELKTYGRIKLLPQIKNITDTKRSGEVKEKRKHEENINNLSKL